MVCVGLLVRQYGKNRTRTNPTTSFFLYDFGGSDKSRFLWFGWRSSLLGTGVLGDSLGSFADCVLGQFSGQEESDGRLDFSARDGRAAIVVCQTRRLGCDALEDVVDERVHDRHGLAADAGVRVDLFQHLVDVDGIALLFASSCASCLRYVRPSPCWRPSLLPYLLVSAALFRQ